MIEENSIIKKLQYLRDSVTPYKPLVAGRLVRVSGLTLEVRGISVSLGSFCDIESSDGMMKAAVVGFDGELFFLMPVDEMQSVTPGAKVYPLSDEKLRLSSNMLGRVLDGNGDPIDGKGSIDPDIVMSRNVEIINPLEREMISKPMDVGIKAINTFLTIGRGQRIGLFANSGVGKSVTLGMITRGTEAQIVVVGLVGERGREVQEFIEESLGEEGLKKSVIVAAPADNSPLMRLRACETATFIAEYFRSEGMDVVLMIDSLTRYAQAQREIALSSGEPPATKGYPPSIFALLPKLVERAGQGTVDQGSITGIYTVLVEGDERQDPIADSARAILDGHIYLNRDLAEQGHYPAIHVESSLSRVLTSITTEEHQEVQLRIRSLISTYEKNKDLINIGAYAKGSDPNVDKAILFYPKIKEFLVQRTSEVFSFEDSLNMLKEIDKEIQSA